MRRAHATDSGGRWPARRAWARARSYRLQPCPHLPAHARHLRKRGVGDVQSHVVAGRLEHGQSLLDERGQLLRRALRLDARGGTCPPGPARRARRHDRLPQRARSARDSARRSASAPLPAQNNASMRSISRARSSSAGRDEGGGALEQADGGGVVLARGRRGRPPAIRRRRAAAARLSSSGIPSSAR